MVITTDQLMDMAVKIIKYIEAERGKKIILGKDDLWYQKIWHEQRNLDEKPPISLGYLDEDIDTLKKIIEGKDEPNDVDINRLSALLAVIGSTMRK